MLIRSRLLPDLLLQGYLRLLCEGSRTRKGHQDMLPLPSCGLYGASHRHPLLPQQLGQFQRALHSYDLP